MNRVGVGGPRRERLARVVSARRAAAVRAHRRTARCGGHGGGLAQARLRPATGHRARSVGRRMVSARLLRRRHPVGIGLERRMPHRFHRPVLGGDFRRRLSTSARCGRWRRSTRSWSADSDGLVKLFTPAFDRTPHDPGYIKAYPPGLRENGGQYTHAAMWSVLAFAQLGDGDRAAELFSVMNPINHASTRAGIHRYKVEPYVVCADVYSAAQHIGRGGWTWYTGSAAWMYRTAMEGILGIHLRGRILTIQSLHPARLERIRNHLQIRRIPLSHRGGESQRRERRGHPSLSRRPGNIRTPCEIALVDDGRHHYGLVTLG